MSSRVPRPSMDLIGALLVGVAYAFSVVATSLPGRGQSADALDVDPDARVVQVMHWQLEPGFREGLQAIIEAYHDLPHVQAAGVRVEQLAVPNRVYAQILNVHVISGTAPDLCQQGTSTLTGGNAIAQYFEGLGAAVSQPNAYNQPEYLPDGLDPRLVDALANRPWRDTFLNGMQSGWNVNLQDFYSVPTSFAGTKKLFVNESLLQEAKAYLRDAASQSPPPGWYARLLRQRSVQGDAGFVSEDDAYAAWLATGGPPDTLGRFILIGHAIQRLYDGDRDVSVVPIAGSNYSYGIFATNYLTPFTASYAAALDLDYNVSIDSRETWFGWQSGAWSFRDPAIRSYFECLQEISRLFPAGFLGLDREQARRRFVSGQAAMIASGVWDAASIFQAAEGKFEVSVIDFPLPGLGERWADQCGPGENSVSSSGGAQFMVNRSSPNRDWALDFLRFLTSYAANQRFNQHTAWVPIVLGTVSNAEVEAFRPDPRGVSKKSAMMFSGGDVGQIATRYEGELKNYLAGDLTYDEFVERVEAAAADPFNGVDRVWDRYRLKNRDWVRNADASLAVQVARDLLLEHDDAQSRVLRALRRSSLRFNGQVPSWSWHRLYPDQPFPEFP